jgi:chromosome segregation ATPase
MAEESDHEELRQQLRDVEAQLAEVRVSADELRAQLGGQSDGAQDSEDIAATLTGIEEYEGVLSALEQRRETVLKQLGEDG